MSTRKTYSPEFKAKAAIEAIKGYRTCNEIAAELGVHPVQVAQWKKQALDGMAQVFANPRSKSDGSSEALLAQLYQKIGQLEVERDWLKKKGAVHR
jgi:transposase-like protein